MLLVKQIKSSVKIPERQRETLKGLGLRKIGHERKLKDTVEIRGMINKIPHLVSWEEVK